MGVTINYNALPDVFSPLAQFCAFSLQGLTELRADRSKQEEKTDRLATASLILVGVMFAASVVASLVTRNIKWLIAGGLVSGTLAFICYYLNNHYRGDTENSNWIDAFKKIVNGEGEVALPLLRQQLKTHTVAQAENANRKLDSLFKPKAYENFAYLDIRFAHANDKTIDKEGYNRYMLKSAFPQALLMGVVQHLNTLPSKERRTFLNEIKPELILCRNMLEGQRGGPSEGEKATLTLLLQGDDQTIDDHLAEIKLPTKISVGHAFLVSIINWMNNVPKGAVDRITDPTEIGKSFGGNNLKNWKVDLVKARNWLVNDKQYNDLEDQFIDALGNANNMREFWEACYNLPKDTKELFKQKALQF